MTNSIPESALGFVWKGEEEILEDAKTEFSADPNSAQWNTGEALQMKFADPGLMAKWIDEKKLPIQPLTRQTVMDNPFN